MHGSLTGLLIILVVLVFVSGFFSAAEIGMMSLNRYRLHHLVKKNNKRAIRVSHMLQHPERVLSVVLIGNTIANIVASTVATLIGQRLHGDAGVAIATLLLTLAVLVFAEMTPKTLAALYPQQVAFATARWLQFCQYIFLPLVRLISAIANGILRAIGVSIDKVEKETLSREELRTVVHEAGSLLPTEHKSMLISLLDLEQACVEDIMVPKADIVGVDIDLPWSKVLEQLELSQHTRLPVYRGTIDQLVGLVHVRNVLNLLLEDTLDLDHLMKITDPPYFIPEGTPLNTQLLHFQKMKRRSCFVVDEYGELQGLVVMEDILEEVVGEFTTDVADLSKDIMPQEDGSYIIDASIAVRHLNRLLHWQLPSLGARTLSGLIMEYLGYIPNADSCLRIKHYQIEVLKVGDNTIKSVRLFKCRKG